jgi:hypothetical protein
MRPGSSATTKRLIGKGATVPGNPKNLRLSEGITQKEIQRSHLIDRRNIGERGHT